MRKGVEHFLVPVASMDELPEPVQAAIRHCMPDSDICQMISIPPQQYPIWQSSWRRHLPFGWRKTPRRTLVFGQDLLVIVEAPPDAGLNTIVIPFDALLDINLVTVLLYAYLEFTWTGPAQVDVLRIEFNLVGEPLVRRGIDRVRSRIAARTQPSAAPGTTDLSLKQLPLKFRNYLRQSVLPGEALRAAVFQPAIRQPGAKLRPWLSPNRAVAVTDQHIIVIEEDLRRAVHHNYTVNTHFFPLHSIRAARFDTGPDAHWLHLELGSEARTRALAVPLLEPAAAALREVLGDRVLS